eukprot:14715018-Alexandrium_andersonii.AAC.1
MALPPVDVTPPSAATPVKGELKRKVMDDDTASVGSETDKSEHRKNWASFQRSMVGGKGSVRTEKAPAEIAT